MAVEPQITVGPLAGPRYNAEVVSITSAEFRLVPVTATVNGVITDPTTGTVQAALTVRDSATPTVFFAAAWETRTATWGSSYFARIPVNSGSFVVPAIGYYDVWLKITLVDAVAVVCSPTPLLVTR